MTMTPVNELDRFLTLSSAEIERRAYLATDNRDALIIGAARFRRSIDALQPIHRELTTIPVTEHLGAITASAGTTSDLCSAFLAAAPEVPWIATPRLDDGGVSAGLAPLNDVRDFGQIVCGLMLLAPSAAYPEHSHPPHEIYLPIAGHGEWRYGGAEDYVLLEPDALVYNHPNDRHGALADDEPLLALYLLWR